MYLVDVAISRNPHHIVTHSIAAANADANMKCEHVQCAFETDFSNLINGTNQIGFAAKIGINDEKSIYILSKCSYTLHMVLICVHLRTNQWLFVYTSHNIRLKRF